MDNASSHSFNNSPTRSHLPCFYSGPSSTTYGIFMITHIVLLLPLCIPVLFNGLQKRRRSSTSPSVTSFSDGITCHIAVMEMIGIFGCILCFIGSHMFLIKVFYTGKCIFRLHWYGEILFHILMSFEQYLAVVQPVTYLSLKTIKGIRIRNISTCCVWLFSIVLTYLVIIEHIMIPEFCLLISALAFNLFFSLSVLCVLIRPGPVEQGENRKRVDQSKQRAFFTIVCILGALVLKFAPNIIMELIYLTTSIVDCVLAACFLWFNVPSSLLLPILFLHREGKFVFKTTPSRKHGAELH